MHYAILFNQRNRLAKKTYFKGDIFEADGLPEREEAANVMRIRGLLIKNSKAGLLIKDGKDRDLMSWLHAETMS